MTMTGESGVNVDVALLAEGVDRNCMLCSRRLLLDVALLAEGVDRNSGRPLMHCTSYVALLAEGVDRNPTITQPTPA